MNIPDEEVQRSLAICLRSMEEHIPRDEPIYPHVERCVEWLCALPVMQPTEEEEDGQNKST